MVKPPSGSDSQQLCAGCGLCCDGSLFPTGELLDSDAVDEWRARGLECRSEGTRKVFVQSCVAYRGSACGIFEQGRPSACRSFRCRPLRQLERGTTDVLAATAKVSEAVRLAEAVKAAAQQAGLANHRNFADLEAASDTAFDGALAPPAKRAIGAVLLALDNFSRFAEAEITPASARAQSV